MSKQLILALGAGGAAAAAVVASAASIGTVDSTDLGAGTTVVASCDSSIDVSYTTAYNATTGEYDVSSVTLDHVAAACIGQRVKIALSDGTSSLAEADVAVPVYTGLLDDQTADFTVNAPAADVTEVAVVISGTTTP
ncbi:MULTISPECIES: hypothetical protein [unclassified Nocardioides]|uniref:hypothetical protein n=1 Tax=unclassified Nocardioides TaxID=2615069 RepID=UPI0000570562|nr:MULTISPECIES: hypothetical protein [unclassified Nocardioides]ABL81199.1 hypothetical protein Noca_1686 [Nocardioides sp. JS614]MDI6909604.1 hypothetical protein [Nocardioides sp.]